MNTSSICIILKNNCLEPFVSCVHTFFFYKIQLWFKTVVGHKSLLFPLRNPQRRHTLRTTSAFRTLSLKPSNVFFSRRKSSSWARVDSSLSFELLSKKEQTKIKLFKIRKSFPPPSWHLLTGWRGNQLIHLLIVRFLFSRGGKHTPISHTELQDNL